MRQILFGAAWLLLAALALPARAGGDDAQEEEAPRALAVPKLPSLGDARLTLPWESLRDLLQQLLERPAKESLEEKPPVDAVLSAARYRGTLNGTELSLRAEFNLKVLKKGWALVPLFGEHTALAEVTLDGKPAAVAMGVEGKGGGEGKVLVVRGPGEHRLSALLAAKAPAEPGVNETQLEVPVVAEATIDLDLPGNLEEVSIEGAVLVPQKMGARTHYRGTLPSGGEMLLRYTVPAPHEVEVAPKAKLPPKVFATCSTLVSIEEGSVRSLNLFEFEVRDGPTTQFSFQLPKGYAVAEVSGTGVIGTPEPDDQGVLRVTVNFEVKGNYTLRVAVDKPVEEASFALGLPVVLARGVEQQKGFLGIQVTSGAEITLAAAPRGVTVKDFSELPAQLAAEARSPIVLAFAYRKADFQVDLHVQRHTAMKVLDAAIDQANLVAQLTPDGKAVLQAVYTVRNNNRQFMRLVLPEKAQLWSTHVNNRPVKPSQESGETKEVGQRILIPLERSVREGGALTSFEVEVIFFAPIEKLSWIGRVEVPLPACDLPVSQMFLSVFLDEKDRFLLGFGGDLQEEYRREAELFPIFRFAAYREAPAPMEDVVVQDRFAKFDVSDKKKRLKDFEGKEQAKAEIPQAHRQLDMEQNFQQRVQEVQGANAPALPTSAIGTLPAKFELPRVGSVHRFQRLVVLPNAPSALGIYHAPHWMGALLWWLVFIASALMFWLLGRHLWQVVRQQERLFAPYRLAALVPGLAATFAVPLAIPLDDYPLTWGLLAALILWTLRQVLLRGWPLKPLLAWWRARKAKPSGV